MAEEPRVLVLAIHKHCVSTCCPVRRRQCSYAPSLLLISNDVFANKVSDPCLGKGETKERKENRKRKEK
jgi:hypothetical protein